MTTAAPEAKEKTASKKRGAPELDEEEPPDRPDAQLEDGLLTLRRGTTGLSKNSLDPPCASPSHAQALQHHVDTQHKQRLRQQQPSRTTSTPQCRTPGSERRDTERSSIMGTVFGLRLQLRMAPATVSSVLAMRQRRCSSTRFFLSRWVSKLSLLLECV